MSEVVPRVNESVRRTPGDARWHKAVQATLQFAKAPLKAHWADLHETPIQGHGKISIKGHNLTFTVEPNKIVSLCVEF